MTRGGRNASQNDEGVEGPLRRCIATGAVQAPERMVRFVAGPDGAVVPDILQKLPGRGCWVSANANEIDRASARGLFAKALKQRVNVPAELSRMVEALLVRRCVELLGLARRAGQALTGFAQVEEAFRAGGGRIAALVEASDSGPADRGKLVRYARREGEIPVAGCLTKEEIGLAFGRESVVHAALSPGPLAIQFMGEAERLGGFRVLCPADWNAA